MEVTRNTFTARGGALLSRHAGRAGCGAMWRLGFPANSTAPGAHCGAPRRPRTGCWPGPSTAQTDRGAQVAGLEPHWLSGTRLSFPWGFVPIARTALPTGLFWWWVPSLPAPLPACLLGHTLNLHPLEVFPVTAQPEEEPTDLCTDVQIRRQEELPERGLAETGWPWA